MTPPGKSEKKSTEATKNAKAWPVFAFIGALWMLGPILQVQFLDNWEHRGQFGDMFGAINSLFTGLAFAGLIVTITLQRRDLEAQRESLALTRIELERTATAQERSEVALNSQAELMARTTRIAALNATLEHFQLLLESQQSYLSRAELEKRRLQLFELLDKELNSFVGGPLPPSTSV